MSLNQTQEIIDSIVDKIFNSQSQQKSETQKQLIEDDLTKIAENIEHVSESEKFFKLPLCFILSVISKASLSLGSHNVDFIESIIKNTIKTHKTEKETLFLLNELNVDDGNCTLSDCVRIIMLFSNSPLCVSLGDFFFKNQEVDVDYEFLLSEKQKEVESLQSKLKEFSDHYYVVFPPVTKQPDDFEPNIFLAVEKGKLSSVQYLIEQKKVKPSIVVNEPIYQLNRSDSLVEIACHSGHLSIVQYLIELCRVSPHSQDGMYNLLHCACQQGHLPIVKYLIEGLHFDIDATDQNDWTPLYYAVYFGHKEVVKYLLSKGANIDITDASENTPLQICDDKEIAEILKSHGTNKH